ncbi:YraN family protein [Clostridium rectalis]|uniref:YraN family protein n=1 Tax=Clostridium rectalis TaxID=2040295 RepID=UPI000F63D7AF|nr:YraN family protein [Clostridium rectalis]
MYSYNKNIGNLGESLAEDFLLKNNYKIIIKNFKCKLGEIDIISKKNNYICFIEVKARLQYFYGAPREAVNYRKQQKIRKVAQVYILKNQFHKFNYRFDVIEIIFNRDLMDFTINHIKNAF